MYGSRAGGSTRHRRAPVPREHESDMRQSGRRQSHPDLSVSVTVDGPVIGDADEARTARVSISAASMGGFHLYRNGPNPATIAAGGDRANRLSSVAGPTPRSREPVQRSRCPRYEEGLPRSEFREYSIASITTTGNMSRRVPKRRAARAFERFGPRSGVSERRSIRPGPRFERATRRTADKPGSREEH